MSRVVDPFALAKILWPDVYFYPKQREMIESVRDDRETDVPAGNKLGKDFVAAFIVLWFFLTRHPCRVITTSTKDEHLDVLWGEMGRYIQMAKYPLDSKKGGPLIINHHAIRKIHDGEICPISYVKGMVASSDSIQSFQGHHVTPMPGTPEATDGLPRTLFVGDEATSLKDEVYRMVTPWASRILCIGNPWPSENFFKRAVKGKRGTKDRGGNIPREFGGGYHRRVIQIKATDSPNVQLALREIESGKEPSGRILVPGVKSYDQYAAEQLLWDEIQKTVSHRAEFYEGDDVMLIPEDWLDIAEQLYEELRRVGKGMRAKTLGVDSAMGGDNTAWAIAGEEGLVELISKKTPDTSVIPSETLGLMQTFHIKPSDVYFDYGGGGKPHVDVLRKMGINVNAVMFGTPVMPEKRRTVVTIQRKKEEDEVRYAYKNRRAQIYGMVRIRLDPSQGGGWAIPPKLLNRPRMDEGPSLRGQLAAMPLMYDEEGRLYLPSKHRKPDAKDTGKLTLMDIIGCSPDEADAVGLAVYGIDKRSFVAVAGA